MRVVGTAGHVDHGKSALVRALTGTEPDRWEEERRRGMTLDLGFAHLRLDGGIEAGIVDVPGHERFVHNMLAGATGMDVLLLIVAANEGPRPQTFEHLAILSLLAVPATIVVLTKSDLVDEHELAAVRDDVALAVAGTVAEGAPVLAVSALTGAGLDALRAQLGAALAGLPPRAQHAPAYLPIDRAFTLTGHGTIVTGTLMQGSLAVDDVLTVRPGDTAARVRSLEVFGSQQRRVDAGSRVAVNLSGVPVDAVARGSALVAPEIRAQTSYAVRFQPLPEAGEFLRRRTPVRVHLGAGESFGTLVFAARGPDAQALDATLHLREAAAAVPGQRFVVRRMSPKTVLGGGTIGIPAAADADVVVDADMRAVRTALAARGLAASTAEGLAAAANVTLERTEEILAGEAAAERVWTLGRPVSYVDAAVAEVLLARVLPALTRREEEAPWMLGATSLALTRELEVDEALLVRILAAASERERLLVRAGYYANNGFEPRLTPEQSAFFEQYVPVDAAQPLVPAPFEPLVTEIRRSRITGLSGALDTLTATGKLIRVGEHVYRGEQLAEIRTRLIRTLRAETRITAARFRDAVGTSRKYIVPLLEFFDATGVTIRDGDHRALRAPR
ncbi:MAG TPA: selenocysteine-specific translation elongation factor [Candidatus Lustribacter sp.]|jgi:selenocysteine-specific elongation factor|nr:selenocysteine-specific translation elongation factor [Candidatus Lustribacter sp.]